MIYVLVPVRDEAPSVGLLLWKIRQVFAAFDREYQLLVVDDGSADGTEEVLEPYARALPVTLVRHEEPRGYGRSLEELLRMALGRSDRPRRDVAVTIQADFSESPDDIPDLIRRIESGADVALADARRQPGMPLGERLARRAACAAARGLVRLPGWEAAVGTLRAYRLGTLARALDGRHLDAERDGWAADAELWARAARAARRVDVVPVVRTGAEKHRKSRLRTLRALLAAVRTLRAGARVHGDTGAQQRAPGHGGTGARAHGGTGARDGGEQRPRRGRGRGRGRRGPQRDRAADRQARGRSE